MNWAVLVGMACALPMLVLGCTATTEEGVSLATPAARSPTAVDASGTPEGLGRATLTPTFGLPTLTPAPALTAVPQAEASVTVTPAEMPTTAPPMATATEEAEVTVTPTGLSDRTGTPQAERVAVSGVLNVIWGDPPPDSNLPPRMDYVLADGQGQNWSLVFDQNVYWPPGGPRAFSGKQVRVEGELLPNGEINRILVDFIRLE